MSTQTSQASSVAETAAIARSGPASRSRTLEGSLFGGERRWSGVLGQSLTWLCGGALALNVLLILTILALLAWNGLGYFWQEDLVEISLKDGTKVLGEIWEEEVIAATAATEGGGNNNAYDRLRVKTGNRDVTGIDFAWIDRSAIASQRKPADAILLERLEWGNFHGYAREIRQGGTVLAQGSEPVWEKLLPLLDQKAEQREKIRDLERGEIGDINYEIEQLRLDLRELELRNLPAAESESRKAVIEQQIAAREAEYQQLADRLFKMREELIAETLVMATADGETREMPVGGVVSAIRPDSLGVLGKLRLQASRIVSFVSEDPRESNTEGGIFPAIFGTVMMVFLMSFAVAPLGVLAAIYLREYAKQGLLVRLVRIAVNNLAGVPSIVFGVFGLGFFVYLIGGSLDRLLYPEALPTPTFGTGGILWAALTLALLTVPVVIVAAEEGLAAVPRIVREGSLALGATKFETIRKVVIPAAAPGILTGMILAMARAAGEVAPLMIVGMVKLAPTLPLDGNSPFVHLERKFMHLGFHIFDVGFQSPNIEATTPLVFATALLLILVVTGMNLVAIALRNHLRRKYAGSAV
jgi:phosphate transport system permease protein